MDTKVYHPQTKQFYSVSAIWLLLILLFCAASYLSGTQDTTLKDVIEGALLVGCVPAVLIILLFFFTSVSVSDNDILVVKMLCSRTTIAFKDIKSLTYHPSLLGGVHGVAIHYRDKNDNTEVCVIGSYEAYGKEVMSDVISRIVELNTRVSVDEKIRAFIKKHA